MQVKPVFFAAVSTRRTGAFSGLYVKILVIKQQFREHS